MDFLEGLPPSQWLQVIMVVVARLSKYAIFVALRHPFSMIVVATTFLNHVFEQFLARVL